MRLIGSAVKHAGLIILAAAPCTAMAFVWSNPMAHRLHAKGRAPVPPSEQVLDLLDRLPPGPFEKEDGSLLVDADGRRVG